MTTVHGDTPNHATPDTDAVSDADSDATRPHGRRPIRQISDIIRWCRAWKPALAYPSAYLVLDELAGYVNEGKHGHTEVWPSLETIMANTGLSRATVVTSLKYLEQVGAITAKRTTGGRPKTKDEQFKRYNNRYRLELDSRPTEADFEARKVTRQTRNPTAARRVRHPATPAPSAESCPQPSNEQTVMADRETVYPVDAKRSNKQTISSKRTGNNPPGRVSTDPGSVRPTRREGKGEDPFTYSNGDPVPAELRPIIHRAASEYVRLELDVKTRKGNVVRDPTALARTYLGKITSKIDDLRQSPGPWSDWLAHGHVEPAALANALVAKMRGDVLHPAHCQALDEAVRRSNPDQGGPALADTA